MISKIVFISTVLKVREDSFFLRYFLSKKLFYIFLSGVFFSVGLSTSCNIIYDAKDIHVQPDITRDSFQNYDQNLSIDQNQHKDILSENFDIRFELDIKNDSVNALRIVSVHTQKITSSTATIQWFLNHPATGFIEYGETTQYGLFTPKEASFKYDRHHQQLKNLKPYTIYHFRVQSEDKFQHIATSKDNTFRTLP